MEIRSIKKLGLSTLPSDASEPAFSEKQGGEDSSDDLEKVVQPTDYKAKRAMPKQKSLLQNKRELLRMAAANADSMSSEALARVAKALLA